MRVLLTALLFHVGLASKITIYESGDAAVPYVTSDSIAHSPVVVIFQSSVTRGIYRAAVLPAGLKDDLIRTDPAYQDLAKILSSDQELSGLYANMAKFENPNVFDIPLAAGDRTIVPQSFKVADFLVPQLPPLMIITYPAEMQGFQIKDIKQVGLMEF